MYWLILCLVFVCIVSPTPVYASDQSSDDALLADLQKRIQSITDTASESRLNADYLPGIMSVYYGKDLAAKGIRTVGEAMTWIPGVHFSLKTKDKWKTIVRGLPETFASGHLKMLLNATPVITVTGMDLLPNMPIDLVDRIEMIRGPASTLYGESAFSGVVNIVTHNDKNNIFFNTGSYDTYGYGGNFFKRNAKKDLTLALNISLQSTKRGYLATEEQDAVDKAVQNENLLDTWGNPIYNRDVVNYILRSKESQSRKDLVSAVTSIDYKRMTLKGYYTQNTQGDFYSTYQGGVALSRSFVMSDTLTGDFSTGFQHQGSDENYARFYLDDPDLTNPVYTIAYSAQSYTGELNLFQNHFLFADNTFNVGIGCIVEKPPELERTTQSGPESFTLDNQTTVSLYAQDTLPVNDQLTLTMGLRYTRFDQYADHYSPRASLVYRLTKDRTSTSQHLLKAQYAGSFRKPTFFDLVDPGAEILKRKPAKDLETNDTVECAYIYHGLDRIFRLTGFYSFLDLDTLQPESKVILYGSEVSIKQDLYADTLSFQGNGAYAHTEDKHSGDTVDGTIAFLANASLHWTPLFAWSFTLNYSYAGKATNNSTQDSDPVHATDISGTYTHSNTGLSVYWGVKNIFNAAVRYPSHLDQDHLSGNNFIAYPEGCQRPERWWWINIAYAF